MKISSMRLSGIGKRARVVNTIDAALTAVVHKQGQAQQYEFGAPQAPQK
ncbi:MAG: hypothetical protein HY080_09595 [Gammaproteobacteria bacterium]|nr:hypothetical protein [Gammaproteobacteria bacterium]